MSAYQQLLDGLVVDAMAISLRREAGHERLTRLSRRADAVSVEALEAGHIMSAHDLLIVSAARSAALAGGTHEALAMLDAVLAHLKALDAAHTHTGPWYTKGQLA